MRMHPLMPTEKKNAKRKKCTLVMKKKENECIENEINEDDKEKENNTEEGSGTCSDASADEKSTDDESSEECKSSRAKKKEEKKGGRESKNTQGKNNKKGINSKKSINRNKNANKGSDESDTYVGTTRRNSTQSSAEIERNVLNHMELSYRPHSVQDLLIAFKNEIKKSALVNALDALVEKGRVISKAYNKSAVYLYNYANAGDNSGDMHEVEQCIKNVEQEINALKDSIARLREYPPDEHLIRMIGELREKKEKVRVEMEEIRKAGVDKAEYDRLMSVYKRMAGIKKCRMGILRNVVGELCEGMGKKRGEIVEELGLSEEVLKK
ncbi:TBP-1 interacting protein [Trachipleistophora hominis]|uniref:TBP-1 interacting protein n=1 Tax=Trachipleistophora hominis TaxID=72359 RepID=L7JX84_TRAHO|nr:TBP-1 interacting protein [Trachipleistophora hominis]